jgi:hypothetical protein
LQSRYLLPGFYFNNKLMKRIRIIAAIAFVTFISACASHEKKIMVYASSDIQIDESQKNITVTEGTTHHEKMLEFSGSDPVTLNVQSPAGKFTLQATDDGLYIANLKPDTVVGSYQHIGADNGTVKIAAEQLQSRIDSLRKLIADSNVNAANKNYFIKPASIAKITAATNAKIFGPFTTIPSGFDAGSVPEIYKFYSVKEEREIIEKLTGMGK